MSTTAAQRVAFEQSRATALDSTACLIATFRLLGVPDSMLDVGCGGGHLVRIAGALGAERSIGLDVSLDRRVSERFSREVVQLIPTDLRQPVPGLARTYDLTLCLEVAEHLPPESAGAICDTLAKATAGTLLFSAATPGQGGSGHLNEQPHEYWRAKLEASGLRFDPETTETLRRAWNEAVTSAWWYPKNLMVFRRPA